MALSDVPAPDLDASYETILVFFNANKIQQTFTIAGANAFSLHPIQADATDADAVVQTAGFNDATDTFTIPARTTAVFVSTQALTPPLPASTLDWVGKLWPRGGAANQVVQGAFAPAGFDIFVRVYDAGATEAAGAAPGIACTLHWGKYGAAWTDVPMSFSVQQGNDDEYKATLSQATLNALGPGTYGFTAYCQRSGEDKKWKVDSYDIGGVGSDDDQGDGLITVIPAGDPRPAPAGGVFVHLFEWKWTDIQRECPYLAGKGYTGVQVSPPMEHLVPAADMGAPANDYPWWVRYQPVSYSLAQSRSGTLAEFQAMVIACNAAGVDIIADAVINHMTGPGDNAIDLHRDQRHALPRLPVSLSQRDALRPERLPRQRRRLSLGQRRDPGLCRPPPGAELRAVGPVGPQHRQQRHPGGHPGLSAKPARHGRQGLPHRRRQTHRGPGDRGDPRRPDRQLLRLPGGDRPEQQRTHPRLGIHPHRRRDRVRLSVRARRGVR